jgi:hypothetical protein
MNTASKRDSQLRQQEGLAVGGASSMVSVMVHAAINWR